MPATKTLLTLTDAALRTEFRFVTPLAAKGDTKAQAHWKLVAAEMDRRGVKG